MRASLFWVVTHCMLVVVYRRFGTACRCHFKCRNAENRCVIIQKVVWVVISLQGMKVNQSGWNTGENKVRGRGDFRITSEKV
jgi:hypothetical protein